MILESRLLAPANDTSMIPQQQQTGYSEESIGKMHTGMPVFMETDTCKGK